MSRTSRSIALAAALLLLVVGLAGGYAWGNSRGSASEGGRGTTLGSVAARASSTGHNAADVRFAQQMTGHHTQALEMAGLARGRAGSRQVEALAATIEAAQQPEIDTMTGWLTSWGAATGKGMAMGRSMPGGMSQDDMTELEGSNGDEFDTMFLTMMTEHHEGALTMATDELDSGVNADALALASSIYLSQRGQIEQMRDLLG